MRRENLLNMYRKKCSKKTFTVIWDFEIWLRKIILLMLRSLLWWLSQAFSNHFQKFWTPLKVRCYRIIFYPMSLQILEINSPINLRESRNPWLKDSKTNSKVCMEGTVSQSHQWGHPLLSTRSGHFFNQFLFKFEKNPFESTGSQP